ncbi:uncharacterized protein LOC133858859 [Alnus glutinosa]|uniref:uncharacterized protein LOC133858859 n=1 Tax=Alnus glutinosa TaxID=3517 RepID=UPI002D78BD49|nr:uncharacterized protein LOC133858859 [Alnus glutinosa]
MHGFIEDTLRMRLFPFSLKDKAKHWFKSLEPNIVTSWTQMQEEFLKKYFLIGKTNQIRKSIISFAQFEGEQFHETWERLKDFLRKCPHHAVPKWQLVQCFYDGLTEPHRQMVDASCGGTFMMKSENEAWILFDNLSENSVQHASTSRRTLAPKASKTENIFEASTPFDVTTKVDALSRKINQLMAAGFAPTSPSHISPQQEPCSFCSSTMHHVRDCPAVGQFSELSTEQANVAFARPGNDPYSNTYNPGWRNHSNFSWQAQASDNPMPQHSNQAFRPPSNIYRPPHQQAQSIPYPPRNSAFEDKVMAALGKLESQTQLLNSHSQSISKLETQVGQLANTLNRRMEGTLPSQPVMNPKGHCMIDENTASNSHHDQVQAITVLRSGKLWTTRWRRRKMKNLKHPRS